MENLIWIHTGPLLLMKLISNIIKFLKNKS